LLVTIALVPLTMTMLSLAGDATELVRQVQASPDMRQALEKVVAAPNTGGAGEAAQTMRFEADRLVDLARRHGMGALGTLTRVAGALTTAIIGIVVFVYGFYVFLQHSPLVHRWLRERAPLRPHDFERLAGAYAETGRGLLLGVGLTAVLQGLVATIGYVIVDIPHALVLGLLTIIASLLPAIGSALVWVPVAAALALSGRTVAAGIILAIGLFIGVVDNFVRPALSRYGKLRLPVFVLFVSMLGGLAAFGGWGVILGPLVVRLAVEAFDIMRDQIRSERRDLTPAGGH
jgi:predicted PurR-regulated permease PerM